MVGRPGGRCSPGCYDAHRRTSRAWQHVGTWPRASPAAAGRSSRGTDCSRTPPERRNARSACGHPDIRTHEGGAAPDGSFYVGSTATTRPRRRHPVAWPRPHAEPVLRASISNGIAWSPDGTLATTTHTPTHEVLRVDRTRRAAQPPHVAAAPTTRRRGGDGPGGELTEPGARP
ncbi:SMP-30/gluconolactonase/LRE family protein [Kocuria rhizophila]|nr:SMP-30/gluconolactonase/LRE family protein [Kocuria rhizophila]